MSVPQTYGASLYDLAKDEGMSREILLELEGIVSLFNEHPAYVKILDAPQIERDDLMEILNEDFLGKVNRYVLNFLKLLSEKHSVHHIGECFKTYEKLYNEDNSIKLLMLQQQSLSESIWKKNYCRNLKRKQAEK